MVIMWLMLLLYMLIPDCCSGGHNATVSRNKTLRTVLIHLTCITILIATVISCVLFSHEFHIRGNYVCPKLEGRLGNQLFQYASVYGISRKINATVILGRYDEIVKYFLVPSAEIRTNRNVCKRFVIKKAKYCCAFDETLMQLNNTQNYLLGVYLQSWKYFEHVSEDLRKELVFKKKDIFDSAHDTVQKYRDIYSHGNVSRAVVVGIHIRRGDIVSNNVVNEDGVFPVPDQYINHAIGYFTHAYSPTVFIVCSDGIDYAKDVMSTTNANAVFLHSSAIEDLAVLSRCDHVILTVGTFGWWAGFLSNGTVLYYKYPVKEGSNLRKEFNYNEYFLPHWIGIE